VVLQKNYAKKMQKISHTQTKAKKKHKIEVPFSLFPKCIKRTKKPKKLEICEKIYLLKK